MKTNSRSREINLPTATSSFGVELGFEARSVCLQRQVSLHDCAPLDTNQKVTGATLVVEEALKADLGLSSAYATHLLKGIR